MASSWHTTKISESSPRRFDIHLGGLKDEFEQMALEIESLRKDRGDLEAKIEAQAVELQALRARDNFVCRRCSNFERSSTPRIIASFRLKDSETPSSSRPVLLKPSSSLRVVNASQPLSSYVTTQPFQTTSQSSDAIVAHSEIVNLSSPFSPLYSSTVYPDSGSRRRGRSITFNKEVERALDVEIAHALSHSKPISCVNFSQDGKHIAAGCVDGKVYVYDVKSGKLTQVLRNLLTKEEFNSVCFTRDGKYLATGTGDGGIYIWKISTKYVRNAFKGHIRYIMSLDFSPNGRLLVSASDDSTVRLWNIHDGSAKFLIENNAVSLDDPCYSSAVFSPDGACVAASHRDGMVRIWGVRTGQLMRRIKAHDWNWVNDVAFMPDGKGLLTGGGSGSLKYWDVGSLAGFDARSQTINYPHREATRVEEQTLPERRFSGHKHSVTAIAISPDGRWIASGSRDGTTRIWDSRNAAKQCSLNSNQSQYSVDFSPAGGYLASGGKDGIVRIWSYAYIS